MGLNDFLAQIPAQLILMTCGSFFALIALWSVILYRRNQRRNKRMEAQGLVLPTTESQPETAVRSSEAKAESSEALRKIGQSVRNFFFYTDEEKQEHDTGKTKSKNESSSATAAPAMTFAAQPQPDDMMEAVEVLRVWRDTADGSLLVQIGTARYRTLDEIRAAGQTRRFFAVMRDMEALAQEAGASTAEMRAAAPAEMPRRPAPVPEAPAPIKSAPQEALPPSPPTENPAPPVRPAPVNKSNGDASAYKPAYAQSAPMADAEPLGSFFDNVKRAVRERGKEKAPAPMMASIPDQIEVYLQYKLSMTPPYLGRSIHVRAAPDGGVRIEVDGVFHESVDDIPDADVRDFVRGAIQEWQEKQ